MKKPFVMELPTMIEMWGNQVKWPTLLEYCRSNSISIPVLVRAHRMKLPGSVRTVNLESLKQALETGTGVMIAPAEPPAPEKTDEELLEDINARFSALDMFTYGVVNGEFRSMIVSGNPGTGKTYTLEYILEAAAEAGKIRFESVRGYVRPTGLFKLLWQHREKGSVLMLDDADSVFNDEIGLNLLKGALDTTKKRTISWRSEKQFEAEDGEMIPSYFDFNGSIIFVSNINFQRAADSGHKLAPHLAALMSRSFYLDLNMTHVRELLVRIESVVKHSDILSSMNISKKNQQKIVDYIRNNVNSLRELSLRTVIKLGTIWNGANAHLSAEDEKNFITMANASCLKRKP